MSVRHDGLTATELLLWVRHHEGGGGARRDQVCEVACGLGMGKVVLDVRTSLDDENLELGIGIRETASDNAGSCSACSYKISALDNVQEEGEEEYNEPPAMMRSYSVPVDDIVEGGKGRKL